MTEVTVITLEEDTVYVLPTNTDHLYKGYYTITSVNTEVKKDLLVKGGEESGLLQHHGNGKFIDRGSAVLENLGLVVLCNSSNGWADFGDHLIVGSLALGGGGIISADNDNGDSVEFKNNTAVTIKDSVFDCSDWGHSVSSSHVYGGAIYAMSDGHVKFVDNGAILFEKVGIASLQDTDYSYKNFYGYGGVVYAPELTISSTRELAEFSNLSSAEADGEICADAQVKSCLTAG